MKFKKVFILFLLFLLGSSTLWAFDVAEFPTRLKKKHSDSLMYDSSSAIKMKQKYSQTLGILPVQDKRTRKFFVPAKRQKHLQLAGLRSSDDFFVESIPKAVEAMLFLELANSGLFGDMMKIPETVSHQLSPEEIERIRVKYNVDLILAVDLTRFNMVREKTGPIQYNSYIIKVDVGMVAQLLESNRGLTVWADQVHRETSKTSEDGSTSGGVAWRTIEKSNEPCL